MGLVVYTGFTEVFVTTPELENDFLLEYFEKAGRDPDDYDREEFKHVVEIEVRPHVQGESRLRTGSSS